MSVRVKVNPVSAGQLNVDFSAVLHMRGTDFTIFRNQYIAEGDQIFDDSDNDTFKAIIRALMSDEAGVEKIHVRNFSLILVKSSAVLDDDIIRLIADAIRSVGHETQVL